MKKMHILFSLGLVVFLGCSPTGGNPDAKPSFFLNEVFSKDNRIFINCRSVEYEVTNAMTFKKVPLSLNEQLRTVLRDNSSDRLSIKRQMYNSYTLYDSNRKLVKNYFARDKYPFIGIIDENSKVQNDNLIDKVSFDYDIDIKLLETCYSLGRSISIENKGYPVYIKSRISGCENLSNHYVAWWNEKIEKLVITELNDFFKSYTDRDMYQYLPNSQTSDIITRLMINSDGIYKVDWKVLESKLSYTYIPSDNSKESINFSKLIDKNEQ
jgi:hypothetical protein